MNEKIIQINRNLNVNKTCPDGTVYSMYIIGYFSDSLDLAAITCEGVIHRIEPIEEGGEYVVFEAGVSGHLQKDGI